MRGPSRPTRFAAVTAGWANLGRTLHLSPVKSCRATRKSQVFASEPIARPTQATEILHLKGKYVSTHRKAKEIHRHKSTDEHLQHISPAQSREQRIYLDYKSVSTVRAECTHGALLGIWWQSPECLLSWLELGVQLHGQTQPTLGAVQISSLQIQTR